MIEKGDEAPHTMIIYSIDIKQPREGIFELVHTLGGNSNL